MAAETYAARHRPAALRGTASECMHATGASLRLCAILFPFTWQHVYIPILPARLLDILQARAQFGAILGAIL